MTHLRFSKPALIGLLTVLACGAWLLAFRLDPFIAVESLEVRHPRDGDLP